MTLRPWTTEPAIGVTRAVDFDGGFLPETRHLMFDELTQQLRALTELIEEFGRLTADDTG